MTSIARAFLPVVVLEMHCRNSYPIDVVKCTRAGPILPAGYSLIEGKPRPALSRTVYSHKVSVVVNVKGLNLIST